MNKKEVYSILTNLDCNLNCKYCFEHCHDARVQSVKDCCDFVDAVYLRSASLFKYCPDICLVGGESFIHPDLVDAILERIYSDRKLYNFNENEPVMAVTNATPFVFMSQARDLVQKWKDKLYLKVSINGQKDIHDRERVDYSGNGTWDKVIEGVDFLKGVVGEKNLYANYIVSLQDLPRLSDSIRNLAELGFQRIKIKPVSEENWDLSVQDEFYGQLMDFYKWYCSSPVKIEFSVLYKVARPFRNVCNMTYCHKFNRNYLSLGFDRQIYGCHRFATFDRLAPRGFLDNNNKFVFYRPSLDFEVFQYKKPEKCLNCELACHCEKCPATAFQYEKPEEYEQMFSKCGWTHGLYRFYQYFRNSGLKPFYNRKGQAIR